MHPTLVLRRRGSERFQTPVVSLEFPPPPLRKVRVKDVLPTTSSQTFTTSNKFTPPVLKWLKMNPARTSDQKRP